MKPKISCSYKLYWWHITLWFPPSENPHRIFLSTKLIEINASKSRESSLKFQDCKQFTIITHWWHFTWTNCNYFLKTFSFSSSKKILHHIMFLAKFEFLLFAFCNCPRLWLICFPCPFFSIAIVTFFPTRPPSVSACGNKIKLKKEIFMARRRKKKHMKNENKVKHSQINCKTIKRTHINCSTCDDGRVWRLSRKINFRWKSSNSFFVCFVHALLGGRAWLVLDHVQCKALALILWNQLQGFLSHSNLFSQKVS